MIVIEPGKIEKEYFKDLWRYKDLFYFLAWRDILVRYKQTVIGVAWSVIRPLTTMIVFSVVFGKIAKLPSNGIPYPVLVYSATLPWMFFSTSLSDGANSLIANNNLISKIYFPRIIVPISTIVASSLDFFISFCLMIILMCYYRYIPSINIIYLPLFFILVMLASLGPSLLLSSLNVKYRDFRYIVPFVVQFGLYVSPVGFSSDVVPEKWRLLYSFNPMVGVIDGFRWCLLGGNYKLNYADLLISFVVITILLLVGFIYFRRSEKLFVDVI